MATSASADQPLRVEGLLQRRTPQTKTWRVRYMILDVNECMLVYFKQKVGPFLLKDAQGRIDLRGCFAVELSNPGDGYFGFHVHARDGNDSFMRTRQREERDAWMRAIRLLRDKSGSIVPGTMSSSARGLGAPELRAGLSHSDSSCSDVRLASSGSADNSSGGDKSSLVLKSTIDSSIGPPGAGASTGVIFMGRSPSFAASLSEPAREYSVSDFAVLSILGKGAFARVFLVRKNDTGKIYAMKVIQKDRLKKVKQVEHTKAEKDLLAKIDHPFIVKLRMAFQSRSRLFLILEYVSGGELFYHQQRQGRFTVERSRLYLAETVLALEYLHSMGVIYRDLKLENMLLDAEGHIKLSDFGLIKMLGKDKRTTSTFCGTPEYLAPEIIVGAEYSFGVDWWSLGIVAYEMVMGKAPFEADHHPELYEKILHADISISSEVPAAMVALIRRLLDRNPLTRIGLVPGEIQSNPFFAGTNWDDVINRRVVPAFQPFLASEIDASNFDPEFTRVHPPSVDKGSPPVESAIATAAAAAAAAGGDFASFDYFPAHRLSVSTEKPLNSADSLAQLERLRVRTPEVI